MSNGWGKGSSVPVKIMAGLAVSVLLGLGLCGTAGVVGQHSDKLTEIFFGAGALFFWVGLLALILFAAGWAIVVIGKSLFGKKD
jgi:hypothetical protein